MIFGAVTVESSANVASPQAVARTLTALNTIAIEAAVAV
jgi:hypothetical protein